jgi:hypothetical protein
MARIRTPAQTERQTHAKSAWTEYLSERSVLAERKAKLKAQRLAAETAKPVPKA